jgi:MFS family permease
MTKLPTWLPQLNHQIWILVVGRFLSQIGTGLILFYAPIFFVNEVGLSATSVGIGLGSGAIAGAIGFFFAGTMTDSRFWGRRRTLLLSCAISALADVVFLLAHSFPVFVIGNLLLGLGNSLYWPSSYATVSDLTQDAQREEGFALTGLADTLGSGLGIILGGILLTASGLYRLLFVIDCITFLIFFTVVYWAIIENRTFEHHSHANSGFQGWLVALSHKELIVFDLSNILFTIYFNLLESTMPLYFTNVIRIGSSGKGFSPATIGFLFSGYIIFAAISQLPLVRFFNRISRVRTLMISMMCWGCGFTFIWFAGTVANHQIILVALAMGMFAIAHATYYPPAIALITELAPEPLRGVYIALDAQCWTIGYLIGPSLGGWSLDQSSSIINGLWATIALSTLIGLVILQYLHRLQAQIKLRSNTPS